MKMDKQKLEFYSGQLVEFWDPANENELLVGTVMDVKVKVNPFWFLVVEYKVVNVTNKNTGESMGKKYERFYYEDALGAVAE